MSDLRLVPVSLAQAKNFVGRHHRHNIPASGWKFGVGVAKGDTLVGVAMAGQPVSRVLAAIPATLEVTRTCTDGTRNANSMLYGAIARAAKALGYRRLYTYTLASESGASLKASGWTIDAELKDRDMRGWENRGRDALVDLFGNQLIPSGPKVRWRLDLVNRLDPLP